MFIEPDSFLDFNLVIIAGATGLGTYKYRPVDIELVFLAVLIEVFYDHIYL